LLSSFLVAAITYNKPQPTPSLKDVSFQSNCPVEHQHRYTIIKLTPKHITHPMIKNKYIDAQISNNWVKQFFLSSKKKNQNIFA
jgi:hypothetical protein